MSTADHGAGPAPASRRWRIIASLTVAAVVGAGVVACGSSSATASPHGTCPTGGVGDRLYPQLGIPRVTVRSTQTHLVVASGLRSYSAQTRLNLTASAPLRCAAVDFAHGQVLGVAVDGRAATWTPAPGKVIVHLGHTLAPGTRFDVSIRTHTAVPELPGLPRAKDSDSFPPGVFVSGGIMQEVGQPGRAHYLVPMADYPAQKAPWRIEVDAPPGMTVAFTGRTTAVRSLAGGRRRFVAVSDGPLPTDVLQLAVGHLELVRGPTVDGVQLRSYLPPSAVAAARRALVLLPGEIRTMTRLLGPFPFRQYGLLATHAGGDLEDQTLTLVSVAELRSPCITRAVLFHELVHEWFGDSVSIARWSDLWLAEGHAVYYQGEYGQPCGTPPVGRSYFQSQVPVVRRVLRRQGPIAAPRASAFADRALAPYGPGVYEGGPLALYALRTRVGRDRFTQIERRFVSRYRLGVASTADYLDIVAQVAGATARTWFSDWLYRTDPPALPAG